MLAWQSQVLDGLHLVHLLRDLHLPDQAADQGLLRGAVTTKLDSPRAKYNCEFNYHDDQLLITAV